MELFPESMDVPDSESNKEPHFLISINKHPRESKEALIENGGVEFSFLKKMYLQNSSALLFLDEARQLILSNPNFKNVSEIGVTSIYAKSFYSFTSELHYQEFIIFQSSYILEIKDCYLLINYSYRGENVKQEIDKLFETISISEKQ